jgi:hypothetical protein
MPGCTRCVLPANYRGLLPDEEGVCRYCHSYDQLRGSLRDWPRLEALRDERLRRAREIAGDYDCLVGISGGKDSSWVALELKRRGLRVLGFTFVNGFLADWGRANVERVVRSLDIDHFFEELPWDLHRQFYERAVSLFGTPCPACSYAGYSSMFRIALERGIPLIVHGRSRSQMFRELAPGSPDAFLPFVRGGLAPYDRERDLDAALKAHHRMSRFLRLAFDADTRVRFREVFLPDLDAYRRAPALPEFMGWFLYQPYDERAMMDDLEASIGWERPRDRRILTHGDCEIHEAADHCYRQVFGYPQLAFELAVLVREGDISRADALARLDEIRTANIDAGPSLDLLCQRTGLDREQLPLLLRRAARRHRWRTALHNTRLRWLPSDPVLG